MAKSIRSRCWATIIYGEHYSDVSSLISGLESLHIPCALSPLHDSDVRDDGTLKKSHYHLLLHFDVARTRSGVESALQSVLHSGLECVSSEYSYYRYLTHADSPEKHRYDDESVSLYGGYQVPVEKLSLDVLFGRFVSELLSLGIYSVRGAFVYATEHPEYMVVVCDRAYALKSVLSSFDCASE